MTNQQRNNVRLQIIEWLKYYYLAVMLLDGRGVNQSEKELATVWNAGYLREYKAESYTSAFLDIDLALTRSVYRKAT